jgi:hypothetical protein
MPRHGLHCFKIQDLHFSHLDLCLPWACSCCFLDELPLFSIGLHFFYPGSRLFFNGQ